MLLIIKEIAVGEMFAILRLRCVWLDETRKAINKYASRLLPLNSSSSRFHKDA